MQFSYSSYINLMQLLQEMGYRIVSYDNFSNYDKCAIIRHDVDFRLQDAVELAKIEKRSNIESTYFLLLTSDFYNVFSLNSKRAIDEIVQCGHDIGLHFDEARYLGKTAYLNYIKDKILEEADVLSRAVGMPVTKVSMHRPSKKIIDSNLEVAGMVNTYNHMFFTEFKYFSDSRHLWREPIEDIIKSKQYDKFQILIHPFWYGNKEIGIEEAVQSFINSANIERYQFMNQNISDLQDIVKVDQIRC